MRGKKERNNKESMICLMPKPSKTFFFYRIQSKENFFTEKELFKEKKSEGLNKKQKEGFLTALAMVIRKDPTILIRKHANEVKVYKKTEDNN